MIGIQGTKNYPFSCPEQLWEDWKTAFDDVDANVNEALILTLARETLRADDGELSTERRDTYETLLENYDQRRD